MLLGLAGLKYKPFLRDFGTAAEERLLGALRQSVPQNGRVHLHIVDFLLTIEVFLLTVCIV